MSGNLWIRITDDRGRVVAENPVEVGDSYNLDIEAALPLRAGTKRWIIEFLAADERETQPTSGR